MKYAKLALAFALGLLIATNVAAQESPTMPIKFPATTVSAEEGQYVLCPPRLWVDKAVKNGTGRQTFIWYTAVMQKPGSNSSTVKTLAGNIEEIPNPLIIPIRRGEKVQPGDVVLTWWQSGSGMQRAIVVGGTDTRPLVRYLDLSYESPSKAAQKDHQLEPDSFQKLTSTWQPGTAVMVAKNKQHKHARLLAVADGQVMILSSTGGVEVHPKSTVKPLPIKLAVKTGDKIFAPVFGTMKEVEVLRVDSQIGRVFTKFKFGGKDKEKAIAFGNLASSLGGTQKATSSIKLKNNQKPTQTQDLYRNGNRYAQITAKGEVWIEGSKVGSIEPDGEIWVQGNKAGDLTDDGEVWKSGDKIGDITSKGEVWLNGEKVGDIEKDGTVWIDGNADGSFEGGSPRHAAIVFFFGFFEGD